MGAQVKGYLLICSGVVIRREGVGGVVLVLVEVRCILAGRGSVCNCETTGSKASPENNRSIFSSYRKFEDEVGGCTSESETSKFLCTEVQRGILMNRIVELFSRTSHARVDVRAVGASWSKSGSK